MIETKEQFDSITDDAYQDTTDGIWICDLCGKPAGETDDCRSCQIGLLKQTIEDLRPLVRAFREERILSAGKHGTVCTWCNTSWLTDKEDEHHETGCIFFDIPRWLGDD